MYNEEFDNEETKEPAAGDRDSKFYQLDAHARQSGLQALHSSARRPDARPVRAFGFNQDSSCIAIGTSNGFRVFMSDPLECKFEREGFQDLKIAQLLFNTQIVALVSDSEKNKVTIWDEYQLRKVEAIVLN